MGGWYLLVYSYSFNQLKIKTLLTYLGSIWGYFNAVLFQLLSRSIFLYFWVCALIFYCVQRFILLTQLHAFTAFETMQKIEIRML